MTPPVDHDWIIGLPKAEIHLHLEGCLDPAMVRSAAARGGAPMPDAVSPSITSLPSLLAYLDWSCGVIDRPDDLHRAARDTARRAAAVGVGHIDVIVNPTHWPGFADRLDLMIEALDGGFAAAETEGAATATLCLSLKRTQTEAQALALVDWMLDRRHPRVSALSIDGDESSGSHNDRFVAAFARAGRGGLRRCAHAGESSGPVGVRQAVEMLGAERIDHGVRAVEDATLVSQLAARRIPLNVCLTSNAVLGVVPDVARHPADDLRRRGVPISLNTDDPLLYDVDVAGEYALAARTFGWGRAELAGVARTSIEASFAPEARRQELLAALDTYVVGSDDEVEPTPSDRR